MRNYYALMNDKKVKLAAAYVILDSSGESMMFRTFDDVLDVTYRVWLVEELIKDEEKSCEKEKVIEEIEWFKRTIRMNIREKKNLYASVITSRYAKACEFNSFYEKLVKTMEMEDKFDFYEWISEINSIK